MITERKCLRVGSRSSQLAMKQTEAVLNALKKEYGDKYDYEIVQITTKGDRTVNKALFKFDCTNIFVGEIGNRLLEGDVDFVVHSLKDVCTTVDERLVLCGFLERGDKRDCVIWSEKNLPLCNSISDTDKKIPGWSLKKLPPGATVGTSSPRRISQLKMFFPHLKFKSIRGNLHTRLQKLDDPKNGYDAIVMAYVGWKRLGETKRVSEILPETLLMPPTGQGIIVAQCRSSDEAMIEILSKISCIQSFCSAYLERWCLAGCTAPSGITTNFEFSEKENMVKINLVLILVNPNKKNCHIHMDNWLKTNQINGKQSFRCLKTGMIQLNIDLNFFDEMENIATNFMKKFRITDPNNIIEDIKNNKDSILMSLYE